MRNRINAQTINVIVDRQDRNDVAGICVLRGYVSPQYSASASHASARAHAPRPGTKPGAGKQVPGGKRLHQEPRAMSTSPLCRMQERLPLSWRTSRRHTFTSRRLASIG
jgi:hypothetical protein